MTQYSPGKFVWFELKTRHADKGKDFYTNLLPWTTSEMPYPGGTYTMFHAGERAIGGIAGIGDDMPDVPEHWLGWVSVEDVDATAAAVTEHGGQVVAGPMDMPEMMRMAFCVDAEGAPFAIMKSTQGDQPDVDTYPGIFHWNEYYANDGKAAADFYAAVFGYTVEAMDMGGMNYYILSADGNSRAGVMTKPMPEIPSMWLPYVDVEDVDATIAALADAGGKPMNEVMTMPGVGRFGMALDPQGAAIAFITPEKPAA